MVHLDEYRWRRQPAALHLQVKTNNRDPITNSLSRKNENEFKKCAQTVQSICMVIINCIFPVTYFQPVFSVVCVVPVVTENPLPKDTLSSAGKP